VGTDDVNLFVGISDSPYSGRYISDDASNVFPAS
jgi:hypothetical protein